MKRTYRKKTGFKDHYTKETLTELLSEIVPDEGITRTELDKILAGKMNRNQRRGKYIADRALRMGIIEGTVSTSFIDGHYITHKIITLK